MNRTYRTIIEQTDFGPYSGKIIIPIPEEVSQDAIAKDTFSVFVERRDRVTGQVIEMRKGWTSPETFLSKGYCEIQSVTVSDEVGIPTSKGKFAVIELITRPFYHLTSLVTGNGIHNKFIFHDFKITQLKSIVTETSEISGLIYDTCIERTMAYKNEWYNGRSTYTKMPLQYGCFSPKIGVGKKALVIWLHGAGEGGSDPELAYTGNAVTNLTSDMIQSYFGGAYVLAPQSPTVWMDDGEGTIALSGNSIYTDALMSLIEEFVQLKGDIDRERIYIGGCSNGGFMTMRMILDYPGYFAAAYPVCEALLDEKISDSDIERLKQIPIWFTHAKNDTLVEPDKFVVPTYQRLIAAGHDDAHFSFFDTVIDSRGYNYDQFGHASWIPMLNDDCRLDFDGKPVMMEGKEVTLLQWLSTKKK